MASLVQPWASDLLLAGAYSWADRHDGTEQAPEPVPLCQGHVWEGALTEEVALSEPEGRTWPSLGPCSALLPGSSFSGSLPGSLSSHMEAWAVFILSLFSQAFPPHSLTLQGCGCGSAPPWVLVSHVPLPRRTSLSCLKFLANFLDFLPLASRPHPSGAPWPGPASRLHYRAWLLHLRHWLMAV